MCENDDGALGRMPEAIAGVDKVPSFLRRVHLACQFEASSLQCVEAAGSPKRDKRLAA